MKILFMGTPNFSVPILEAIHKNYEICGVVTQPDKPVGRKKVLTPSPVKEKALELNLPIYQPQRIKEEVKTLLALEPDVIITAAYGQILPKELLEVPPYKAVNVHASLLPKLRGGAPIQRAIMRGFKETGVTIMYMSQKMDAGAILNQKALPIASDETSETLFEKLSYLGRDLLLETLPKLFENNLTPIPQNTKDVTYAYNLKPEEELLDFNELGDTLEAKIRAFYPEPNTYTYLDLEKLKVIEAKFSSCENFYKHHSDAPNGTVLKIIENGIAIKTPNGKLIITKLQLAGKKAMDVKDFMNGAGKSKVKLGMILKTPH